MHRSHDLRIFNNVLHLHARQRPDFIDQNSCKSDGMNSPVGIARLLCVVVESVIIKSV